MFSQSLRWAPPPMDLNVQSLDPTEDPLLWLEAQAAGGQRVGVGFAQHDAVSQKFKKDIVVAAEYQAQGQGVVPSFRAQEWVQLVQDHTGLNPDEQVQNPQRLVEKELKCKWEKKLK